MADITPPTIAITSNKTALKAGDTALITFTLSEVATDFVYSDIVVTGGALSNFAGSGMNYSAIFTPSQNSTTQGAVSVGNFKFSDQAGNANEDGSEANNRLIFSIETVPPTISISTTKTYLGLNETPTIIFKLSENSTNFTLSDITVSGGTLSSFSGSGSLYSAVFTPNTTIDCSISVLNGVFTDAAGNTNYSDTYPSIGFIPNDPANANVVWTRLLGSSGAAARSLTTGLDGSIYVGGYSTGSLDGLINSGGTDAFLSKYNPDGSKAWTRLLASTGSEQANALTTGLDGSIYVGGNFSGSSALDGQKMIGSRDSFLTKFKPDGTKVWTRLIGSAGNEEANALTTGLDGSIYVAGYTDSVLDGQISYGERDAFLIKYNPDGTKAWTRMLGTSSTISREEAYALTTGLDGSIYVGGYTTGPLDEQTYLGRGDAFVTKYSPDGTKIWTRLLGTEVIDYAYSLATGKDGSIYVNGYTSPSNEFVTMFNPDGTKAWTRLISSNSSSPNSALTTGIDGSIYFAGSTTGSFQLGSTSGTFNGQSLNGYLDALVIKFSVPDTSVPKVSISTNKSSLIVGESAELIITLSKTSTNFVLSDLAIQGGTLNNFLGSGTNYTANFTASIDGINGASVSIGSGKFSDIFGIFNEDGFDANNKVSFKITAPADTTPPNIAVTANTTSLSASQGAIVTFTLTESSSNFVTSDVNATGGTLSNWVGYGNTYTAIFTPSANTTANGVISVLSGVFTDSAGNANADGSDANNSVVFSIDTVVPTISLSTNKSSLNSGETAIVNFTISEPSVNFTASDVTVIGGTLSNFSGSGTAYTATFTPAANSSINGVISVSSGVFTDLAGNTNVDGFDSNNAVSIAQVVKDLAPPSAISFSPSLGETNVDVSRNIVITFNEKIQRGTGVIEIRNGHPTLGFLLESFNVATSDRLSYDGTTLTINPTRDLKGNYYLFIYLADGAVQDSAGNKSANISYYTITTANQITTENYSLSVVVNKGVLGADPVLLKGLTESFVFENGYTKKHIVEYAGSTFDYNQIDSLIMTVTRDGEFTLEFTKEINDYLGAEQNITYSAAVAIVGAASIDEVILSVAGADGYYVG